MVSLLSALLSITLAGVAALLLAAVWGEELPLALGATTPAVAAVLAGGLIGLFLGARLSGRWAVRLRRPWRAFALLAVGVAVGALAVGPLLDVARDLGLAFFGGAEGLPGGERPSIALFSLVVSVLVLLAPTACLGAMLPVLVRQLVGRGWGSGPTFGLLVASGLLGAAAGAMAAARLLIPEWGGRRRGRRASAWR